MSDETAPVTTAADQSIAATQETVEAPSTHTPAVGGVNETQEKDETIGRKVRSVIRYLAVNSEADRSVVRFSGICRKLVLRNIRGRTQVVPRSRTRQRVSSLGQ